MTSAEAPIVFAKACEMFILELTLRACIYTEENKRRVLQKNDIVAAISRADVYDFLVDIIPRDELKDEGVGIGISKANIPTMGSYADSAPYYYIPLPPGTPVGPSVVSAGQQPRPSAAFFVTISAAATG